MIFKELDKYQVILKFNLVLLNNLYWCKAAQKYDKKQPLCELVLVLITRLLGGEKVARSSFRLMKTASYMDSLLVNPLAVFGLALYLPIVNR